MVFYIASRQFLPYTKRMDNEFNEEAFWYEGERFWEQIKNIEPVLNTHAT